MPWIMAHYRKQFRTSFLQQLKNCALHRETCFYARASNRHHYSLVRSQKHECVVVKRVRTFPITPTFGFPTHKCICSHHLPSGWVHELIEHVTTSHSYSPPRRRLRENLDCRPNPILPPITQLPQRSHHAISRSTSLIIYSHRKHPQSNHIT